MGVRLVGGGPELTDDDLTAHYRPPDGAWCRANFVVTLDGAIELDGRSAELGGDDDRRVFVALRSLADVVLVGSGTARAEDYGPAKPSAAVRAQRVERGQPVRPPIAVVTNRADLDPSSRLFTEDDGADGSPGARPIVLTAAGADPDRRHALEAVADVVICGDERVDLRVALGALAERDLTGVLCEGGPTILTQLLAGGLLDELCLTHVPVVAGPDHGLLTAGRTLAAPVTTRRTDLLAGDDALFGRYRVREDGS